MEIQEVVAFSLHDLSWYAFAFMIFATFVTSFISSATGMAGGVLMFTALHVFLPLRPLVAMHGAIQTINNFFRSCLLFKFIKIKASVSFFIGAVIGTCLTTLFLVHIVAEWFSLTLLLLFILYTLFKPSKIPHFTLHDYQYIGVGIGAGTIGMLAGAIDPYLAAFFMRDDYTKEEIVATKSVMQFVCHALKIPAFIYLGFSFQEYLPLILVLGFISLIGTKLGVIALKKISTVVFFKVMWWATFFSGLHIFCKMVWN